MSVSHALKLIQDSEAHFVNFRFTDTLGKEQHISFPANAINKQSFAEGKMFDGSSVAGWQGIHQSDMILMPQADSAVLDPFSQETTVNIRCDVKDPTTGRGYERGPRTVAKRAEVYLVESGIGDVAYFGPENEFFLFESVLWSNKPGHAFYEIDSEEAAWNTSREYKKGNSGHRPGMKGGYFAVPPVDSLADVRARICTTLMEMGLEVELHHHEVGTAGQCEIGVRFDTLVKKADQVQILKHVTRNVAHDHGLTATFMPKPIVGDNGSGMHVHQSIFKDGINQFSGDLYGDLSEAALYYIGGIFKHAHAVNAFTNPSTNSYKRLVPGYEAPVLLAYSERNRSAACRIPHVSNPKERRIEMRFPDASGNPYFAFTALLMAGLDGIRNKIHPGDPNERNLYKLTPEEEWAMPSVAASLDAALRALDDDRGFLKVGDVMTDSMIDSYIQLKMAEVDRLRLETHPCEFDMYYSC